jgi:hypothetical protein
MKQETNNKGISEKEVTCTEVLLDHENNICYQRNLTKKSNLVMLVQYFVFQGTTMISIYTLIGPLWNLFPLSDELTFVCFPLCCRQKLQITHQR